MAVGAALGAALSAIGVAYSTPRPDMLYTSSRPLSPAPLPEFRRTDADLFEGVHSEASQPLTQRVLERGMPRSGRTPQWHTAPPTTAHAAQPTRHRAPVHRAPVPPGLTARRRVRLRHRVQPRRRVPAAARLTRPVHPASACRAALRRRIQLRKRIQAAVHSSHACVCTQCRSWRVAKLGTPTRHSCPTGTCTRSWRRSCARRAPCATTGSCCPRPTVG